MRQLMHMFPTFVQRLRWLTKRLLAAIGVAGVGALGLLSVCAVAGALLIEPLSTEISKVQQRTVNSAHLSRTTLYQGSGTPQQQLAQFYRYFPKVDEASEMMARLHAAAASHDLTLEQGEYRLAHERDGMLTRYEIVLPIKGDYLQIRQFIRRALLDVPSLALNGISFTRQKIDEPAVEAQVSLTLYLGRE